MRILITNDDGIEARGIARLAECAKKYGDVTVVAPKKQCSGMSHHITIGRPMELLKREDFPVEGVTALSLDGAPADCVRSVVHGMLDPEAGEHGAGYPEYFPKNPYFPDLVLSGINEGPNAGFDIVYSGTVGAAMEAVMYGIPAICFSEITTREKVRAGITNEITDKYLDDILGELIRKKLQEGTFYNVNFPDVPWDRFRGILYDRVPDRWCFYHDHYYQEDGFVKLTDVVRTEGDPKTDIGALLSGYISVGTVKNPVV